MRSATFALFVLFVAIGSGCATPPRVTAPGHDHLGDIIAHAQAPAVARDYSDFFDYVARKVARLTHDLRLLEASAK